MFPNDQILPSATTPATATLLLLLSLSTRSVQSRETQFAFQSCYTRVSTNEVGSIWNVTNGHA